MSDDLDLEGEELVNALKDLVISLGPYVRDAGSVEQAENTLTHLEEVDHRFHKYEFVRRLKSKLEMSLGGLVENEIKRHSIAPNDAISGNETVVSKITNMILNSKEYNDLTKELKLNINAACDRLMQNFDNEFGTVPPVKNHGTGRTRRSFFCDFDSSLETNSLNQSTIMFMSHEQYQSIADSLNKRRKLEDRREAVKSLYQVPSLDVQNYDVWSDIRRGLVDALMDQDDKLWMLAFKYIARGFSQNNAHTKDVYSTFVDYLCAQLVSWKSQTPRIKGGLDCTRPETIRILKAVRLVSDFQQHIPQYWVRFPEKTVEDIIESTLSLLSHYPSHTSGAGAQVTPLHFLSLLDTKANWFIKWMHGNYSRAPLLRLLSKHKSIVECAVKSCLDYVSSRQLPDELISDISEIPHATGGEPRQMYTGHELEYIYFAYSIHILGCLLCYSKGQQFFPIKVKDRDEQVQVTDLVVELILLIHDSRPSQNKSGAGNFDAANLVVTLFKKLCHSESSCNNCICKDKVTDALLRPISDWLDSDMSYTEVGLNTASEQTLLHVADILAAIASTSRGRKHLLYGENGERFSKSRSSAAHMIADFSKKALNVELSMVGPPPTNAVIGAYIFVCRQLYNTTEGLYGLGSYNLHICVADAWRVANRETDNAATPTPADSAEGEQTSRNKDTQYLILWEDTLRDNLLNFAGTPKGLLLLQQTGSLNDCVSYMYERYVSKMQVSKCEKFGYGFMMTQVAATAPGMVALMTAGFMEAIIKEVWGAIEVIDEKPVYTPKAWPVTAVDKVARKPFTRLLNMLSSFSALYEVLYGKKLPVKETYNVRDIPDSLPALMDRIIMINTESKMLSVYHYEESHAFGLRVLSVLTSCLDSMLLLQSQYKFQDILLQAQADNVHPDSKKIMLDMLSVERNYILVKSNIIGGPTERLLPSRNLEQEMLKSSNAYPLFSTLPVPQQYIPNISSKSSIKQDNDLSKIVGEAKKGEFGTQWLERCRKVFCTLLTTKPDHARGTVLQDLMESLVGQLNLIPEQTVFSLMEYSGTDSLLKSYHLSSLQEHGVQHAVRYGMHLKLLNSSGEATEKLTLLLKRGSYYLKMQQRKGHSSPLLCLKDQYVGFDWFSASVFLLMNGNLDRSWKFIYKLSSLAASPYLWAPRLQKSIHIPLGLMNSGISVLYSSTGHNVELILLAEFPQVFSAFRMSGFTPSQICQHWLRQCFWNYLDWLDICHYICVCLLLGIDYQVYMCVAIFKHLEREILQHMQQQDLIIFLKEEAIVGFHVGEHLQLMQQLEGKFRRAVLADMTNFSKP